MFGRLSEQPSALVLLFSDIGSLAGIFKDSLPNLIRLIDAPTQTLNSNPGVPGYQQVLFGLD